MKYRVKKNRTITYPDGGLRGERGYIVDGAMWYERATLDDFADSLERVERQTPVSSVDVERLLGALPEKAPEAAPAALEPDAPSEPGEAEIVQQGATEEADQAEEAPEEPDEPEIDPAEEDQ